MTNVERIQKLAKLFPSLRTADGIDPWQAHELEEWACDTADTRAARYATRFILNLWDSDGLFGEGWMIGSFDVLDAFNAWDDKHRAAFLAWANDPWWP